MRITQSMLPKTAPLGSFITVPIGGGNEVQWQFRNCQWVESIARHKIPLSLKFSSSTVNKDEAKICDLELSLDFPAGTVLAIKIADERYVKRTFDGRDWLALYPVE